MNKVEQWFLKRVIKREVTQGFHHAQNITNLYSMIINAARNEFTEDNKPTLDAFLQDRHQRALDLTEED